MSHLIDGVCHVLRSRFYRKEMRHETHAPDAIGTLVAQVHRDLMMPASYVQEIYDNISAKDKKLFWIEGTDLRLQGYNYFGNTPQLVLEWFDTHM